jgi:hypothetical protein
MTTWARESETNKNEREIKMETIAITVTPELKDRIEAEAKRLGLSVAAWLRMLAIEKLEAK